MQGASILNGFRCSLFFALFCFIISGVFQDMKFIGEKVAIC